MSNFEKKLGKENFTPKKVIITVAFTAMMTALYFVLDRVFVLYPTESIKLSFNFVPVIVAAVYFGPISAMLVSGVGDLLGAVLMPVGAPNLLLTATAALSGLVYGLLLYRVRAGRGAQALRILAVNLLVSLVINLTFNTLALALVYGGGRVLEYAAINLPGRLIKESAMFVLRVAVSCLVVFTGGKLRTALDRVIR